jgi:hypothetical protein
MTMSDELELAAEKLKQWREMDEIKRLQAKLAAAERDKRESDDSVVKLVGREMALRERVRALEGALKALCNQVKDYTTERSYHSREHASKDLDRREKALIAQLQSAQHALASRDEGQKETI